MDDGRVSVGASGVEVGASVVLLDELVLEVDAVLEVVAEDEVVEAEDEDVSLEVAKEDVVVAEAVSEVSVADAEPVVSEIPGSVRLSEALPGVLETVADALSVPTEAEVPSAPTAGWRMLKRGLSGTRFLIMRLREAWSRGE